VASPPRDFENLEDELCRIDKEIQKEGGFLFKRGSDRKRVSFEPVSPQKATDDELPMGKQPRQWFLLIWLISSNLSVYRLGTLPQKRFQVPLAPTIAYAPLIQGYFLRFPAFLAALWKPPKLLSPSCTHLSVSSLTAIWAWEFSWPVFVPSSQSSAACASPSRLERGRSLMVSFPLSLERLPWWLFLLSMLIFSPSGQGYSLALNPSAIRLRSF